MKAWIGCTGWLYRSWKGYFYPEGLPTARWFEERYAKIFRTVYVRFHGVHRWYHHDYSDAELKAWARRIRTSGAREAWLYFNNDVGARAPANAQTLMRIWGRSGRA